MIAQASQGFAESAHRDQAQMPSSWESLLPLLLSFIGHEVVSPVLTAPGLLAARGEGLACFLGFLPSAKGSGWHTVALSQRWVDSVVD